MKDSTTRPNRSHRTGAFTLVELLVVIGIIALLISVLLPSLSKARKAANTVKCSANLHSIMLAFQVYASLNKGYLMGSPLTTGYDCDATAASGNTGLGYAIQSTDWMTPAMDIMGVKVLYSPGADDGRSNGQARWDRVSTHLNFPGFRCPDNSDIVSPVYNGSQYFPGATNVPVAAPYVSYCTSWVFFLRGYTAADKAGTYPADRKYASNETNSYAFPAANYVPKFSKIGAGNNKVCISDGGRYVNFKNNSFDMTFNAPGTQGGAYADYGVWTSYANGHQRTRSPSFLPAGSGNADDRVLWARHGTNLTGASDSQFRFNAGFFDGHVETLTVDQGTNPNLWGPKGSEFVTTEFSTDVAKRYNVPQSSPSPDGSGYLIPN